MITGSAGFIGFHTARRFLGDGHDVVGFDAFTEYYDPELKRRRDAILRSHAAFRLVEGRLEDAELVRSIIEDYRPEVVVHLAAQAGVRYSIDHPDAYIDSNIRGTFNLLEALRHTRPRHFLFASTSSVYGGNTALPFEETARTAFPVSLYAATKSAGESMTHSYSSLFNIPTTCFRFFTVYGPWGRPDMALFKFVDRIRNNEEIEVYGEGEMSRDFTFVDDLVEGIVRLASTVPRIGQAESEVGAIDSLSPVAPWRAVNIAGGKPVGLMEFIAAIEEALGIESRKVMLPMQPGDVTDTAANPALLLALTGFQPTTPVKQGVKAFVDWYTEYQRGEI